MAAQTWSPPSARSSRSQACPLLVSVRGPAQAGDAEGATGSDGPADTGPARDIAGAAARASNAISWARRRVMLRPPGRDMWVVRLASTARGSQGPTQASSGAQFNVREKKYKRSDPFRLGRTGGGGSRAGAVEALLRMASENCSRVLGSVMGRFRRDRYATCYWRNRKPRPASQGKCLRRIAAHGPTGQQTSRAGLGLGARQRPR